MDLIYNKKESKLMKKPLLMPTYKDKILVSKFDSTKNSMIVPLGKEYNLIGVDVDNKNDTIEFFFNLALDNDFDLNTFSLKTINNGKHYYFRLTDKQAKELKNFKASTALCFSTPENPRNIDIKYTNQIFFRPSYLEYDGEIKKYEIEIDTKPVLLPQYLYDEILRTSKIQTNNNMPNIKIKNDIIKKVTMKKDQLTAKKVLIDKEKEGRIRIYLNCLNHERFDNRDEWLSIGAIIFNECNSYDLFEEYSKKSAKFDKISCLKLWNSFNEEHIKKVTIKKLIDLAEQDADSSTFKMTIINDIVAILENLFNNGPSDVYMAYLFYNQNKYNFVYDNTVNKTWYSINKYGIYIADKEGDTIKNKINDCLGSIIKKEYIRLLNLINNDADGKSTKDLFKIFQALIKYCNSAKNKENLLSELRLLYIVDKIYEKMDDANPNLFGFDNGVYDLETNTFRLGKPEDYVSVTAGYQYKKANPQIKIEAIKLLQSIFPDPAELRYIMKVASLGLYGGNPEEKFYVWIGTGGNGKGLLRDILMTVFGKYYDSMEISYLYKTNVIRADAPNEPMARKKNSRFVVTTEPEKDVKLNASTIKGLTGNDPQQVRFCHGHAFNYTPKFKLVIQSNNDLEFGGSFDGGLMRRPIKIVFQNKFVDNPVLPHERKIDKTLKKKLITNRQFNNEFFEILTDHYKLYLEEGLILPKRFADDTNKFIEKNTPINQFIDKCVLKTGKPKDMIQASELYNLFLEFMADDDKGITPTAFKNTLSCDGITQVKKKIGNFYVGIKMREINEEIFE